MAKVVLSIGGSILIPGEGDPEFIKQLAKMLEEVSKNNKIYVVTGGGRTARYYINLGREFTSNEAILDIFGIEATRLNARLLALVLGDLANQTPPSNIEETIALGDRYTIVIMGGTEPGHTTDAVATMVAEKIGADLLINATSVDGVYTADPKKDRSAVKLETLTFQKLVDLCAVSEGQAGQNNVFDAKGARILLENRIKTIILDGRDLENMKAAIHGKEFVGSVIEG